MKLNCKFKKYKPFNKWAVVHFFTPYCVAKNKISKIIKITNKIKIKFVLWPSPTTTFKLTRLALSTVHTFTQNVSTCRI